MDHLRKHFLHLSRIPADLDAVTTIDTAAEVDPASVGMHEADVEAIWDQVRRLYRSGTHPAITLSIRRRGKVLMSRAIGHARGNGPADGPETEKVLATPDTPICLFSSSKGVTAILMHMLAEEGLVNLMDPVAFYAPEFARSGKDNITIHQILSHRGGIPGLPAGTDMELLCDEEALWQLLCEAKPIRTDGSRLAYHAITGGFVLERVLREVTGEDFNAYVDRKVRQPMGMRYFTYGIDPVHWDELALAYASGPSPGPLLGAFIKRALGSDLKRVEKLANDPRFHAVSIPAANLVASAVEMSAFHQMLLDGGRWGRRRLCKTATVARAVQEFGNRSIDLTLMAPLRYSAGLMLGDEPFGIWGPHCGKAFGHAGLANKFNWADPEREMSVSLLTTGMPVVSHHLIPLAGLLAEIGNRVPRSAKDSAFAVDLAASD